LKKIYQTTRAAELESLATLRQLIDSACQDCTWVDFETAYDLNWRWMSTCTNIITHGYAGMDPGSIILALEMDDRQVRMAITDFGHPFEPGNAPKPDVEAALEDRLTGGFGLFFIYETMDEVDYQTTEDGNCLILVKRLDPGDESR
jgi:anti-sigma regulatory factor (Ser/Thr protein kinase)